MRRDGGSVFPAHANTGDPNGPNRGLSANEIARALISMMARSTTLQSKAGYIDARLLTANSPKSSCYARPDHTLGQILSSHSALVRINVCFLLKPPNRGQVANDARDHCPTYLVELPIGENRRPETRSSCEISLKPKRATGGQLSFGSVP